MAGVNQRCFETLTRDPPKLERDLPQTPGAPPLPVQGPFSSERRTPLNTAVDMDEKRRREIRELVYIFKGVVWYPGFVGP